MRTVAESWTAIDRWLARHAPASAAILAGPASADTIGSVVQALGFPWPAELIESLLCHDGAGSSASLLPSGLPLSCAGIVATYRRRMEIAQDNGFDIPSWATEPWWHPHWLPFGESDGDVHFIDLRPGPGFGRTGIAVHDGEADFQDGYPSLTGYLDAVATALVDGGRVGGWAAPYLLGDEIWWSSSDDDVDGEPLRPAPHF